MTIPKPVREQLPVAEGDILTLFQIDDLLILAPQELRIPALQAQYGILPALVRHSSIGWRHLMCHYRQKLLAMITTYGFGLSMASLWNIF